jgi:arylsulfatase A
LTARSSNLLSSALSFRVCLETLVTAVAAAYSSFDSPSPMRCLLRLLLCAVVVLSIPSAHARPNIVFILADDLGYGETGFNGQRRIRTPNLDRLAHRGTVLSRHYAGNAVCAPSRAVLMTGRNPGHACVRDNRDVGGGEQTPLPAGTATIATVLRSAGYRTGLFGKWGLGSMDSSGSPLKQGFDVFVGLTSQWQAHSHYPAFIWNNLEKLALRNGPEGVPGHGAFPVGADPQDPSSYTAFTGREFSSDRFVEGAETFIEASAGKPFFLYYASPLPHVSLQAPEKECLDYRGVFPEDPPFTPANPASYVPNRTPRVTYAAMITRLDTEVGRIVSALEKTGVANNTLVVFSSDNGPTHNVGGVDTAFFNSAGGLRGLKGSLYEGGVREPTLVCWPGVVPEGCRNPMLSGFEDWLPTFVELSGAKMDAAYDGESLVPTLHGKDQIRHTPLYREFPGYGHQQAIWQGPWKAIRTGMLARARESGLPVTELYQLTTDPSESQNVAAQFPDVVRELEEKMKAARDPHAAFPLAGVDAGTEFAIKR